MIYVFAADEQRLRQEINAAEIAAEEPAPLGHVPRSVHAIQIPRGFGGRHALAGSSEAALFATPSNPLAAFSREVHEDFEYAC